MAFAFLKKIFSGGPSPLENVELILKYKFTDKTLLKIALTHRSIDDSGLANERLEFLGDAILGLVVSEFLFEKFPKLDEGDLTKMKSALVNEVSLSKVFSKIGLCEYILLSREEEKSGGRSKPSITSDTMEALFGAIYLDGGLRFVSDAINLVLLSDFDNLINDEDNYNYKGELLEMVQVKGNGVPRYDVIDEIGPDHSKLFVVTVSVESEGIGTGEGSSKKEAEQKAARMALETIRNNLDG